MQSAVIASGSWRLLSRFYYPESADKTAIKSKVMHVYVSTTVLANDIQILRFISYRDSERELMPYMEATASISLLYLCPLLSISLVR